MILEQRAEKFVKIILMSRIVVLVENKVYRAELRAEHGFSLFVDYHDRKFLFDLGQREDTFLFNCMRLGISLKEVDFVVLSHGHYDHSGGLPVVSEALDGCKVKLYAHPLIRVGKYKKDGSRLLYIGIPKIQWDEIIDKMFVDLTFSPRQISEGIYLSGEINDYGYPMAIDDRFVLEDGSEDLFLDELAVYLKSPDGLVVISGCSHRGILNIVEHGRRITGIDEVRAVIGGFHLSAEDKSLIKELARGFEKMGVREIYPMHCTHPEAICELKRHFRGNCKIMGCGDEIIFS